MAREPTEMELRVARALLDDNLRQINENDRKRYGDNYRETIDDRGWDGQDDHIKRIYLSYARAAIRAMREPTDEMLTCGYAAGYAADDGVDEVTEVLAEIVYTAMIRAASPKEK